MGFPLTPVFPTPLVKLCSTCGLNPRQVSSNKGRGCYCAECWSARANEWNKKNKDRKRDRDLRRKFGVTLADYRQMETAQGGVCAICCEPCNSGRELAQDHNHATNKTRGLLCGNCNRGIGNLRESPAILARAIDYLNKWKSVHEGALQ